MYPAIHRNRRDGINSRRLNVGLVIALLLCVGVWLSVSYAIQALILS